MNFQWYDWVRLVTAFFALVAFTLSLRTMHKHWAWLSHNTRYKGIWWISNVFLILLAEESIEEAVRDTHREVQTVLGFLISIAAIAAQLSPEYQHNPLKRVLRD